jgi:SPP1 family predicted phage head-tail adaptor
VKIGQLRHKITIQKQEGGTNDGGGTITPNWVDVATVWANVKEDPFEKTFANQSMQQTTHTVKIRYRSDLAASKQKNELYRLLFNGRALDIKYIKNTDEANQELVIHCLEE